jgi:hypothetical protein
MVSWIGIINCARDPWGAAGHFRESSPAIGCEGIR